MLRQLGLSFEVRVSDIDEIALAGETPEAMAERLARSKVRATPCDANEIVIGADTLVVLDGRVLGKPEDPEDAVRMLLELSGLWRLAHAQRIASPAHCLKQRQLLAFRFNLQTPKLLRLGSACQLEGTVSSAASPR